MWFEKLNLLLEDYYYVTTTKDRNLFKFIPA